MTIYIEEIFVDASEGYIFGRSTIYESGYNNPGDLFRELQREYGRCVGRVYVDSPDGQAIPVGWSFIKRVRYPDSPPTYLREVWVLLYKKPPTVERTYHYYSRDDDQGE